MSASERGGDEGSANRTKPDGPARGSLFVIFLTVLIDLLGFGIFIPLLPLYADLYTDDRFLAGALVGTYSVVQLIFLPLLGRLSDRIGRRPVLLMGLGGSAIAYTVFALGESLWVLFVARAFAGMFGATISTAQAYVADVTTPATRAKGMGMIGAAFGLGFTFGPPIGSWAASLGVSAPGFFAAGLSAAAFTMGFFRLPESRRPGTTESSRTFSFGAAVDVFADARRGILLLMFLLQTYAFANLEAMFSLLCKTRFGYGMKQMGYIFLFIGLVVAFVQGGMIGRLVKRHGERRLLTVSTIGLALGFVSLGYAEPKWLFFVSCAVIGLTYGVASPTLNALISRNTAEEKQGATFGVAQSCAGLGRALGHVGSGALFALSPAYPFVLAGFASIVVFFMFAGYRRRFALDLAEKVGT